MVTKKKNMLSERAMLIHLKMRMWTGRKKDNKATKETLVRNKADNDAGAFWTYLLPKEATAKIYRATIRCRSIHFKYTRPWMEGGLRILPSALFMTYAEEMRKAIAEFDSEVADFIKKYSDIKTHSADRLGTLGMNANDLPDISMLKDKFSITRDIIPIPDAGDFRIDMGDEIGNEIRDDIANSIQSMTANAMKDLWSDFGKLVGKMEKTFGEKDKDFKSSLINNLKAFCDMIPVMNFTDDPKLEQLRKEAEKKLVSLDRDEILEDPKERKKAHKATKEMLKKLDEYGF